MKPDCRRVLSQIASYSVEELSLEDVDAFTRHLDDCPPCKGQWVLFEKTLTTLSQVGEADISVEQDQQMWLTCLEHARKKGHNALEAPAHAHEFLDESIHELAQESAHKVEVLPQPFRSDSSQREGDRRGSHFLRSSDAPQETRGSETHGNQTRQNVSAPRDTKPSRLSRRFRQVATAFTPAWSLAFAGGAAAVLVGALLASPAPVSMASKASKSALQPAAFLPSMPAFSAPSAVPSTTLIGFQTPPHATTGLIDYHAAMAFEPFSDHVAATLISTVVQQPKPQIQSRMQRPKR